MKKLLESCELCPRRCKVDRKKSSGFCGAGEKVHVALVSLHKWEEPCLVGKNGAGTIFFSHCNLKCVFCQNFRISHEGFGKEISVERLAEIFIEQQNRGAANVELVTPTHYVPQICAAIDIAKNCGLKIPVVYNSNAYENLETLDLLKNRVDIFLPDLKYFSDELSKNYSNAPNYFEVATEAIKKMFKFVGENKFNSQGLMTRGVIVRHLILPNARHDSIKIIDWLYKTFGDKIFFSLMNQYTPMFRAGDYKKISRRLTSFEYKSVVNHAVELGIKNCFIQTSGAVGENFVPDFNLKNI